MSWRFRPIARVPLVIAGLGTLGTTPRAGNGRLAPPPAGYRIERKTRERWMHERQLGAFTPFAASAQSYFIDSVTAFGGARTMHMAIDSRAIGRVTVDARNAVQSSITLVDPQPWNRSAADSAREASYEFRDGLPEMRTWELSRVLAPVASTPLAGQRWTDTIALDAAHARYTQRLHGARVSVIVGDTTVDGQQLWRVRDSAAVEYEDGQPAQESAAGEASMTRRTTGTIVGTALYDAGSKLARWREETTVLAGIAILREPDGSSVSTRIRFERTARYSVYDTATYAAHETAETAALRETLRLEKAKHAAIADHDTVYRDSLLTVWDRSVDPEERTDLRVSLLRYGRWPGLGDRMRAMALRRGDTTGVVSDLAGRTGGRLFGDSAVSSATIDLLLPFLGDRARAFAFAVDVAPAYESLVQGLLLSPPAVTADSNEWPCTPAACRTLAEQWARTTDERLRDVALVARLVMDPKRWADTVMTRARTRPLLLAPAVRLIRGIAEDTASGGAGLPPVGASWGAWQRWAAAGDTVSLSMMTGDAIPGQPRRRPSGLNRGHLVVLQFQQLQTGRNIVAELQRGLATAPTDSARNLFVVMLMGLNAYTVNADSVARLFMDGSEMDHELALAELRNVFAKSPTLADSATGEQLIDGLISIFVQNAAPWSQPPGFPAVPRDGQPGPTGQMPVMRNIPTALQVKWAGRVRFLEATYAPPDGLWPPEVIWVGPPTRFGKFVQLPVSIGGGNGLLLGGVYFLLDTPSGWTGVWSINWII